MTVTYHAGNRIQGLSTDQIIPSASLSDDFSSYADQTSADAAWVSSDTSYIRANITNDNLDFNVSTSSNKSVSRDLTSVSDSDFICRFKLRITSFDNSSYGGILTIGLSNQNSSYSINAAQNFVGFYIYKSAGVTFILGGNTSYLNNITSTNMNYNGWTTGTDYYIEFSRSNTTTLRLKVSSTSSHSGDILNNTATTTNVLTEIGRVHV